MNIICSETGSFCLPGALHEKDKTSQLLVCVAPPSLDNNHTKTTTLSSQPRCIGAGQSEDTWKFLLSAVNYWNLSPPPNTYNQLSWPIGPTERCAVIFCIVTALPFGHKSFLLVLRWSAKKLRYLFIYDDLSYIKSNNLVQTPVAAFLIWLFRSIDLVLTFTMCFGISLTYAIMVAQWR